MRLGRDLLAAAPRRGLGLWMASGLIVSGMVLAGATLAWWLWVAPGPAAPVIGAALPTAWTKAGPFPGGTAPDFELPLLGDGRWVLSEHLGHRVMLNFFATWCEPCREEMPGFQAQAAQHAEHDWVFVGVNVMETADAVEAFRGEFGLTFPLVLDEVGRVSRRYAVQGTPTNIVVNREGVVVDRRLGYMSEVEIAGMVASLP